MRITNNMLANTFLRDLYYNNQRTARVQNQIASGRIVNNPSEDALVADQVISLETQISRAAQYLRNGAAGSSYLSLADTCLGDVNNLAVSARNLAVHLANDTVNASMRAGGAQEVQQMLEQAVEVGNQRFGSRYIFSGLQTTTVPFELTVDGVLYRGDLGHISVRLSDNAANQISVNGADAFGACAARVMGTVDLNPVLNLTDTGTKLRDLNGGRGVSPGSIHLTYGGGPPLGVDVDLSAAETLADVRDMISAATGGSVTVLGTALGGHALQVVGPGTVTVTEVNGNTTARDLGILGSGGGGFAGLDLDPAITPLTSLADLRNGAAPVDTTGFTVTNGSGSVTITAADLAGTVQDLLTKLNNSAANVYAEISADGRSLDIYSRLSGPTMTITENGGTTAADLGIATAGVRADNVFTALMDLRDALNANDGAAVAATIGQLDAASDRLLRARADVGARVQRFEATNQRQDDQKYNLTELISEANDLDYSRAVVDFQQLRNVLEASLRMAAQVLPMSLADFL